MRRAGYRGPEFGDFSLEAPLPHILFYLFCPAEGLPAASAAFLRSLPAGEAGRHFFPATPHANASTCATAT
jgi:hypothetical protein